MVENTPLLFSLPSVHRKKVTGAFDGGRITSDGDALLLSAIETKSCFATRLAPLNNDPRNPLWVPHSVADILPAHMLAGASGYEDADDLDHLRADPGIKLSCGHLPDSDGDLCSQPTVSRWENARTLRKLIRIFPSMARCLRPDGP